MNKGIKDLLTQFDAIKDKLHPNTRKNNEFVRILSAAYKLDPKIADEMWQYVVEQNEKVYPHASARNVYSVYNKLFEKLTIEETGNLICMNPLRVRILFLYTCSGYYGKMFGTIVGCQMMSGHIDDAIDSIYYSDKRYENEEDKDLLVFSFIIQICSYLEKEFVLENKCFTISKDKLIWLYNRILSETTNPSIYYAILAQKSMFIDEPITEKESINRILNYFQGNKYYRSCVEFLYLERCALNNEIINILDSSLQDHYEMLSGYTLSGNKKEKAISDWYRNLILSNRKLLDLAFEKDYCTYCDIALRGMINQKNWDDLVYYLTKGLNQKTDFKAETYLQFIKSVINSIEGEDESDLVYENYEWKRKPKTFKINNTIDIDIPIIDNSTSTDCCFSLNLSSEINIEMPCIYTPVIYVCKADREGFIQALDEICKNIINDVIRKEVIDTINLLRNKENELKRYTTFS